MNHSHPPTALAPYRVLDLTSDLGSLCGRMLADLGADVIKVEPPGGDPARLVGPFLGGIPGPARSLNWLFFNAGKRGVGLDVAHPCARPILQRLVEVSDFVVESFPPGYIEKLGFGFDALAGWNPAIILVRVTPFGQQGPYRDFRASDLIACALGGQMELNGDADRAPVRISVPQAWSLAGAHAAAGAMLAHAARSRSGRGQQVDVSAQESMVWTLMIAAQTWDISHVNPRRGGSTREQRRPNGAPVRQRVLWPCCDGFVYWTLAGGTHAGAVASMRGLVGWLEEEGCAGELRGIDWGGQSPAALDQERYDRLTAPVASFFLGKTKRELFEGAVARSIQLAPANTLADLPPSPQLAAREYFVAVDHPQLGLALEFPGAPVRLSRTPWRIPRAAPEFGEHNQSVYGDLLGLSRDELADLTAQGVI
jgi:crotonobetainyl-CoA:carnitine CoA-transferase CaiB-like acyl-CoA transferase